MSFSFHASSVISLLAAVLVLYSGSGVAHGSAGDCESSFALSQPRGNAHLFAMSESQKKEFEKPAISFVSKADFAAKFGVPPPRYLPKETSGKVLFTQDIVRHLLPPTGPLKFVSIKREHLDSRLFTIGSQLEARSGPDFVQLTSTDIYLWSRSSRGGKFGIVKLAYVDGGIPVAVKTPIGVDPIPEIFSAVLLSELGVGPKFRGVVFDGTHFSYAMEIIPGDFVIAENISYKSLLQREKILNRLAEFNITGHLDYQDYKTPDGELRVIDASTYIEQYLSTAKSTQFRMIDLHLLRVVFIDCPLDVAVKYLSNLKNRDPVLFSKIKHEYASMHYADVNDPIRRKTLDDLLER